MTKSLQILACAAGMASVLSFPITSTTATTTKSAVSEGSSLPFTVLFSAHKTRAKSAYSGSQGVGITSQAYHQPDAYQPSPPTDPYQQQYQQQQQQQQQYQASPPPQQQQAHYNPNANTHGTVPVSTTAAPPGQYASTLPVQPLPNGSTSYTTHSKPWFEDPRFGTRPAAYQPSTSTIDVYPVYQEYSPFAPPAYPGTRASTGTSNAQTFFLPTPPLPFPVEMIPPLVQVPPAPFPDILPPPPIEEPLLPVARHNGQLSEQPTKALIQGNSRRTWNSDDPNAQTSAVWLQAGRPNGSMYAQVKFRNGPSSTPQQMKVYSEDGYLRPLQAYFGRPRGKNRATSQSIDVINTASLEFPISATISLSRDFGTYGNSFQGDMEWKRIQGKNAIRKYSQDDKTEFVRVNLETDGLPLMCNIEVLQGPGDVRQVIELLSDDGSPWEGIVAVPGNGASVIVRNVGPLEFPIRCSVENHGYDATPYS